MKSAGAINPYSELISTLGAAVGPDQLGSSNSQGPYPLHYLLCHWGGGSASIMDDSIPMPNPAEFGLYGNYLAAWVGGVRAARGTSRLEISGHLTETDEDEDGEEESATTDKAGHFVNLSTGSLRELQTGLWGGRAWEEMCEVDVFTANMAGASAHGLKLKPLSATAGASSTSSLPETRLSNTGVPLGDDHEGEAQ